MNHKKKDRILIIGGTGMLGSYVNFGHITGKKDLDIRDREMVFEYILRLKPRTIVHLAAVTDTNLCETSPLLCYETNVVGVVNVALAAREVQSKLVFVSSSRVFSGEKKSPYLESDNPEPTSQYGRSKMIGENIVSSLVSDHLIIRGCWLFGGGPGKDDKFFGNILRKRTEEEIFAINNVYGSPTYAKDFIKTMKELIDQNLQGIYHLSNSGRATREDVVKFIVNFSGSPSKVTPVEKHYFPGGSLLPNNESIDSKSLKLRSWKDALSEYMVEEWGISKKI